MIGLKGSPPACGQRRLDEGCAVCEAKPFSVCGSISDADLAELDAVAERMTLAAGAPLVFEGDPARYVFNVTGGSVRVYRLLPDGRRQITGFLFAGDFIGLAPQTSYAYSVEAIEDASVCRFRKADYIALIGRRRELEAALLTRAGDELAAAQAQIVLLGRKTAIERVASFLLDLRDRDPLRPRAAGHVHLPMTRTEIADYLGLTLETVSRTLARLKRMGLVRQLTLHDLSLERPQALERIAEGAQPA